MSNKCDPARHSEKCVLPCSLGSGHCDPWNRRSVFPPAFFPRFMFEFSSVAGREAQRLSACGFLWSSWHYVHSADPSYAQLKLLKQHFHDWGPQKPHIPKTEQEWIHAFQHCWNRSPDILCIFLILLSPSYRSKRPCFSIQNAEGSAAWKGPDIPKWKRF